MIIKDYQDFIINENLKLILEGDLQASGEFLSRISNIKKNKIAKVLYNLFEIEPFINKDLSQNYIDVNGEDEVSFISDGRLNRLYDSGDDINPYTAKGRGSVKIGRFVSALLRDQGIWNSVAGSLIKNGLPTFTDKDIEEFVNLYKSSDLESTNKFKLVNGKDIPKWYYEKKYAFQKGTLGGSCMKDVDESFFEIYEKNPKVCSLLILVDANNKLLGRALVWKLDKSPCKAEYFMDRVYTARDSDLIKFINYANENKWLYKYRMSSELSESVLFYYKETPVIGKISVKLKESDLGEYPFLDTLCFLNLKDKTLSNVGQKNDKVLGSTDGYSDWCSNCGGDGKSSCYECGSSGKITCENCDGDGCKKCQERGKVLCDICYGNSDCPECTGVLKNTIKRIKEKGDFKVFKNYLPK